MSEKYTVIDMVQDRTAIVVCDPPEDARKVKAMLDITRGYTPECVAACIKAVEGYPALRSGSMDWEGVLEFYRLMDHAINLLPKGQPDAT